MAFSSPVHYLPALADMIRSVSMKDKNLLAISVVEAGRRLGIGRSAAYAAAACGQLPVIRIGGSLRVPLRALERLLDATQSEREED
jgi:excisionase family DNA binding protein